MTAPGTRRALLSTLSGAASALLFARSPAALGLAASPQRTPQPMPSPNAPSNQNVPGGMNNYPSENSCRPAVATFNAAQVVAMVQQLYQLSLELKQETDRTNLQLSLPVDFLKRAQQIEKLAKAIRKRARG